MALFCTHTWLDRNTLLLLLLLLQYSKKEERKKETANIIAGNKSFYVRTFFPFFLCAFEKKRKHFPLHWRICWFAFRGSLLRYVWEAFQRFFSLLPVQFKRTQIYIPICSGEELERAIFSLFNENFSLSLPPSLLFINAGGKHIPIHQSFWKKRTLKRPDCSSWVGRSLDLPNRDGERERERCSMAQHITA